MSVWDDPEIRQGGDFFKFDQVGDSIAGTISAVKKHRFDDGKVAMQLHLTLADGTERTVTAGQVRLAAALAEQRPDTGDHISITYTQKEARAGGKTLKHFEVIVTRGGTPAPTTSAAPASVTFAGPAPAADSDGPPPGVDPAVWATLPQSAKDSILASAGK